VPRLSDFNVVAKRAKDNAAPLAAELVKGSAFRVTGHGPNPKPMRTKQADREGKALIEALYKSATRTKLDTPRVLKGINQSAFGQFLSAYQQMPQQQSMNQIVAAINELATSLGKSISITSPLSSSFAPFDLVAPSRLTYPVYSPSR
jgi:hypothetical protein